MIRAQRFRILNMSVTRLRNAINQPHDHLELLLVMARKLEMKVKRFPGKVTYMHVIVELFPEISLHTDFIQYFLQCNFERNIMMKIQ